jgi:hypothetical protein
MRLERQHVVGGNGQSDLGPEENVDTIFGHDLDHFQLRAGIEVWPSIVDFRLVSPELAAPISEDRAAASEEVRPFDEPMAEDSWPSVVRRRVISQSPKARIEATVPPVRADVAWPAQTPEPAGPPETGAGEAAYATPTAAVTTTTATTEAKMPLRSLDCIESSLVVPRLLAALLRRIR